MKMNCQYNTAKLSGYANFNQFAAALLLAAGLFATGCATAPHAPPPTSKVQQTALTPSQAFEKLEAGNARFVAGQPLHRDWAAQRAQTAAGQYPFAIVLSCVDSRTSSEIIFDQGFGDIFNARVAGNVLDDDILGSMEFACKVAGAKLIVVVGHSHCGAVKGACNGAQLGHLTGLLEKIQPSVTEAKAKLPGVAVTDGTFIETVAKLNVHSVIKQIREQSPVLHELIDSGAVGIVGGSYDLDTGKVDFFKN